MQPIMHSTSHSDRHVLPFVRLMTHRVPSDSRDPCAVVFQQVERGNQVPVADGEFSVQISGAGPPEQQTVQAQVGSTGL